MKVSWLIKSDITRSCNMIAHKKGMLTPANGTLHLLFNVLVSIIAFHSPGGAWPQYLNNWLNPIFAFSTVKNIIPALD